MIANKDDKIFKDDIDDSTMEIKNSMHMGHLMFINKEKLSSNLGIVRLSEKQVKELIMFLITKYPDIKKDIKEAIRIEMGYSQIFQFDLETKLSKTIIELENERKSIIKMGEELSLLRKKSHEEHVVLIDVQDITQMNIVVRAILDSYKDSFVDSEDLATLKIIHGNRTFVIVKKFGVTK
jgi:hypothetical protein